MKFEQHIKTVEYYFNSKVSYKSNPTYILNSLSHYTINNYESDYINLEFWDEKTRQNLDLLKAMAGANVSIEFSYHNQIYIAIIDTTLFQDCLEILWKRNLLPKVIIDGKHVWQISNEYLFNMAKNIGELICEKD